MKTIAKYIAAALLGVMTAGCTDLQESPYTFVAPNTFYQNQNQPDEALSSVYAAFRNMAGNWQNIMRLENCTEFGQPSRSAKNDNVNINDWYNVNAASSTGTFPNVWARCYLTINRANTVLERGSGMNIDETAKTRVFAQARFLRAYCYYYLVRLYGGVPIPAHMTNSLDGLELARSSAADTWDYIIADLEYSEKYLPVKGIAGYDDWRATQGAAQALLGELYLFRGAMEGNAAYYEKSAGGSYFYLRTGPSIYAYESYSDADVRKQVFVVKGTARKGTNETYMEFVPVDKGRFPGSKGWQCCTPGNGKYYDFTTSASLLMSANNFMLLRYSEVLLNYAEALNHLNGGSGDALDCLNDVLERAGLAAYDAMSQSELDEAIFRERGWEFIGEGKLYFDELRTDRLGKNVYDFIARGVAEGMNYFRPLNFVPQKTFLWKIPQGDLDSNPLLEQNPDNISDPRYPLAN